MRDAPPADAVFVHFMRNLCHLHTDSFPPPQLHMIPTRVYKANTLHICIPSYILLVCDSKLDPGSAYAEVLLVLLDCGIVYQLITCVMTLFD